ncbi:hypothetical protein CH75_24005 [Dyella jiangningensis]|nr:hypothetical protein CH75_00925 [Dyella jiangningensis]AHX15958.1 hypothetical protein CH75_24005 [Dyella jiangningensis]
MLENPTARDPAVQQLVDEGYTVQIEDRYLIVEHVPYVSAAGVVSRGALISAFREEEGRCMLDNDHTVWFTGTVPCGPDGRSLANTMVADANSLTVAGRQAQCRLSNKPDPIGNLLDNIYNKMTHYIRKLTGFAQAVESGVSANGDRGSFGQRQTPSPFYFPNDTIVRAGLDECEAKLKLRKVAIIGTGGTGSYLLDALAKIPIDSVHLYDDDSIAPKNVFRMPGALSNEAANAGIKKATYLAQVYGLMRSGIHAHERRIDATNVHELNDCDFVFVAIDDGPSRQIIASHLVQQGIPFIDVGIGVDRVPETSQLIARTRVTLVTPDSAHLVADLPTQPDAREAVYNNIQLVELNALNACLAVIRFKQFFGFYGDDVGADVVKYVLAWSRLITTPDMAA